METLFAMLFLAAPIIIWVTVSLLFLSNRSSLARAVSEKSEQLSTSRTISRLSEVNR
jgi:uncharacterized membrane protein YciS (DUF1049 family)